MAHNPNGNGGGRDVEFTEEQKCRYLVRLKDTGLKVASATDIGFTFATVLNHKKLDPDFADAVDAAMQEYRDGQIEREVHTRAIVGWEEPVIYLGKLCTYKDPVTGEDKPLTIRKKSDRMLELLAKRHIPEYREKQSIDLSISGGVMVVPGIALSPEQWERAVNSNGSRRGEIDAATERQPLLPGGGGVSENTP